MRSRERTVRVAPLHGGKACPQLTQNVACNTHHCPVDCAVSQWAGWSTCSKTCGGGSKSRQRYISSHAAYGGQGCPAELSQTATCSNSPCTCVIVNAGQWSPCSQACGRGHTSRTIVRRQAVSGVGECHDTTQEIACNDHPCSVDCVQSDWASWGACSRTCGSGTQVRTRTTTTYAAYGGKPCAQLSEMQACETQSCPVDCIMDPWSAWTQCTKSCGGGHRTRQRSVFKEASSGGVACGITQDTQSCGADACPLPLASLSCGAVSSRLSVVR